MMMAASRIAVEIHLGSSVNLADLAEVDILSIANEVRLNGRLLKLNRTDETPWALAKKARETATIAAYQEGASLADVAQTVGVSISTASRLLREAGIQIRPAGRPTARKETGAAWEEEAIELYRSGLSVLKTATALRVTESQVRGLLIEKGIPRRPKGSRADRDAEIVRACLNGMPVKAVADDYGISCHRVYQILKSEGAATRPKLSAPQRDEMVVAYQAGMSVTAVADLSGCSATQVHRILQEENVAMRRRGRPAKVEA